MRPLRLSVCRLRERKGHAYFGLDSILGAKSQTGWRRHGLQAVRTCEHRARQHFQLPPAHTQLCLSIWQTPELLVEIETAWSLSGYLLVCFSAGYFIHDTVDIVISHQARASWEYLVHHVMAMGAFFSGIFWSSFVGGGVLTLLVEVSNIFLTFRMMMKINNAQHLLLYRVNKYVNLVMYFLFRLAPQAYLTHYFLRYLGQRTLGTFLLGILLMLDIMILIYFSRLLRSDFCPQRVPSQQHKDKFLTE
uniref:TLC domain-containing protein n=1 Tax=Felis catus TaxID=9685 RepID=A0ABI7Z7V6_FELCA